MHPQKKVDHHKGKLSVGQVIKAAGLSPEKPEDGTIHVNLGLTQRTRPGPPVTPSRMTLIHP